jgi:hypothetical protein
MKEQIITETIQFEVNVDPNADTTALDREIDQLAYELYCLTEQEIAIVEGKRQCIFSTSMSPAIEIPQ